MADQTPPSRSVARRLERTTATEEVVTAYNPTDESAVFARHWPATVHTLKTVQPYFGHVRRGWKTFEIRRDDRGYQPGDLLVLAEWDDCWTGQDCVREIVYVLRDGAEFGIQEGFVVLGIKQPEWRAITHSVERAARIQRETGVNPLAVGCSGDD